MFIFIFVHFVQLDVLVDPPSQTREAVRCALLWYLLSLSNCRCCVLYTWFYCWRKTKGVVCNCFVFSEDNYHSAQNEELLILFMPFVIKSNFNNFCQRLLIFYTFFSNGKFQILLFLLLRLLLCCFVWKMEEVKRFASELYDKYAKVVYDNSAMITQLENLLQNLLPLVITRFEGDSATKIKTEICMFLPPSL